MQTRHPEAGSRRSRPSCASLCPGMCDATLSAELPCSSTPRCAIDPPRVDRSFSGAGQFFGREFIAPQGRVRMRSVVIAAACGVALGVCQPSAIAQTRGTSGYIARLVPELCGSVPCNVSGISFTRGEVRLSNSNSPASHTPPPLAGRAARGESTARGAAGAAFSDAVLWPGSEFRLPASELAGRRQPVGHLVAHLPPRRVWIFRALPG